MDTALPQKISFILDRNLAKANCTENRVCTSCDTVVLVLLLKTQFQWVYSLCLLRVYFVIVYLFCTCDAIICD